MTVLIRSTSRCFCRGTLPVELMGVEEPRVRGDRIRSLREARGMRQSDLAYQADIAVSFLSEIERGNRNPGAHVVARIADVLQTSMDYLMGRTNNPAPASDLPASGYVRPRAPVPALREPSAAVPDELPPPDRPVTHRELEEILRKYGLEPKET